MGKEARKLGSCFIPLAIAAAGLMAGRCTPGIPPSPARHAPEAVEDYDVDLEAVLPLHPEIAASLDAIEGESELEALLSIDDQEAIEGVRARDEAGNVDENLAEVSASTGNANQLGSARFYTGR